MTTTLRGSDDFDSGAPMSKADVEGLGIAANSITGALPAISGAALTTAPKMVALFGPSDHSTAANGWDDMNLGMDIALASDWASYISRSGNIVTIVKAGHYLVETIALMETSSTAITQFDMYLTVTDQTQIQRRLFANQSWNSLALSGTYLLSVGNTIQVKLQNLNTSTYHHHQGGGWTNLRITYLGD